MITWVKEVLSFASTVHKIFDDLTGIGEEVSKIKKESLLIEERLLRAETEIDEIERCLDHIKTSL